MGDRKTAQDLFDALPQRTRLSMGHQAIIEVLDAFQRLGTVSALMNDEEFAEVTASEREQAASGNDDIPTKAAVLLVDVYDRTRALVREGNPPG